MIAKPKGILKKVRCRVLFAITIFAMICTILPKTALAGDSDRFSGGNGSESSPWLISTVEDLKNLSLFLNSGEAEGFDAKNAEIGNCYGYYFEQTTDIDLSKVQNWEPIGYSGKNYFAGNYDGNNYAVSNIKCTGKVDADGFATGGLFGWVAFGSVSNLHVKNAVISATGTNNYSYVGGIAGVVFGSTITNCSVTDSSIESKRTPSNNNCAGGVSGYSTGGVFKNCAATNNTVKAMAYCGGFVGELDDDNNAGESSFTNCFVADTSATAYSPNPQDANAVGGFAGQVTASVLTLTNCFVYNTTIQIDANSVATHKFSGVFAGELWHDSYASIADTNCYYESSSLSNNVGNALKKTSNEFKDGTVAALLGDSYVNADPYPSLASSPANYSAVDNAIAEAKALNKNKYKDFSAVETAITAVVRGKLVAEQSVVDGYAAAIQNAITALQYKDADYSKVDVALSKIPSDLSVYTDESAKAVNDAKNAVVLGKNITEQATVDGYATAIEDAVNGLKKKTETIKPGSDVKDETQDGSGKTTSNNPQKPDKDIPSTGDNTSIGFYFVTLFLSASVVLLITKKRKRIIK